MSKLKAKRIKGFSNLETGRICYWKATQEGEDVWMFFHPVVGLGSLANHDITEHDNGTITVSPSILMTTHNKDGKEVGVHGYLEKGEWRDC